MPFSHSGLGLPITLGTRFVFVFMSTFRAVDAQMPEYLTLWRLCTVIACLCFSHLLRALDATIITVPLPRISSDFKDLEAVACHSTVSEVPLIRYLLQWVGPTFQQFISACLLFTASQLNLYTWMHLPPSSAKTSGFKEYGIAYLFALLILGCLYL